MVQMERNDWPSMLSSALRLSYGHHLQFRVALWRVDHLGNTPISVGVHSAIREIYRAERKLPESAGRWRRSHSHTCALKKSPTGPHSSGDELPHLMRETQTQNSPQRGGSVGGEACY